MVDSPEGAAKVTQKLRMLVAISPSAGATVVS